MNERRRAYIERCDPTFSLTRSRGSEGAAIRFIDAQTGARGSISVLPVPTGPRIAGEERGGDYHPTHAVRVEVHFAAQYAVEWDADAVSAILSRMAEQLVGVGQVPFGIVTDAEPHTREYVEAVLGQPLGLLVRFG